MRKEIKFYSYLEKAFDVAAISILWIICCLPVITIGASCTAMYYAVNKVWKEGRGYPFEEFFRSFKQNLKPSFMLWAVLAVIIVILNLNLGILRAKMNGNFGIFMMILYGLCLFFACGVQMYAFPALSRFDMPVGWILKLSIYLCFRHLGRTIAMIAVTALAFFLVYCFLPLLFILPFVTYDIFNYLLEPVLDRHVLGEGDGA